MIQKKIDVQLNNRKENKKMSYPEHNSTEDAFYNPHGAHSHVSTREEDLKRLHNSKAWSTMSAEDRKFYETWAGYTGH